MNEYPAKLNTGYYRVRTDWNDDASQLGAYKLLANAKAKCDENPGSHVFAEDGTVIYRRMSLRPGRRTLRRSL